MLAKETKDTLESLGFDVSKLEEAVKSDEERSLDVPTLFKDQGITEDQKNMFGKNRFEEGKKAMSEIKAKELKGKYGLEVDGKDLDLVLDSVIDFKVKEVNTDPDKRVTTLEEEKGILQGKINDLTLQNKNIENDFSSKLFNIENETSVERLIPKEGLKLPADKIRKLFFLEHSVTKDDQGRTLLKKGESALVDNVLNPLPLETAVNTFIDENDFKVKSGMGGEDGKGGSSSTAKFKNTDEFISYAAKNGIDPMSVEGQKILADGKQEGFTPSSRN